VLIASVLSIVKFISSFSFNKNNGKDPGVAAFATTSLETQLPLVAKIPESLPSHVPA
jgi:hypothetical protein